MVSAIFDRRVEAENDDPDASRDQAGSPRDNDENAVDLTGRE